MLAFLFKIWGLAKPYRWRFALGIISGVLSGLVAPLMVISAMLVCGAIFPSADSQTPPVRHLPAFVQTWYTNVRASMETDLRTNHWAVVLLISVIPITVLLRGFLGYLNVYFLQWTASHTVADLRTKLFGHLVNLSAGFYSENSSGQLMSRVMNDTNSLQNILSGATAVVIRDPVTLLSLLFFLLQQNAKLTLISLVVLPLAIIPITIYSRKVRRASREMQGRMAELTQIMSEAFTGHRVIKAYNLEGKVIEQFYMTTRKTVGQFMRIVRAAELPGTFIEFFGSVGLSVLLLYLMLQVGSPGTELEFAL